MRLNNTDKVVRKVIKLGLVDYYSAALSVFWNTPGMKDAIVEKIESEQGGHFDSNDNAIVAVVRNIEDVDTDVADKIMSRWTEMFRRILSDDKPSAQEVVRHVFGDGAEPASIPGVGFVTTKPTIGGDVEDDKFLIDQENDVTLPKLVDGLDAILGDVL